MRSPKMKTFLFILGCFYLIICSCVPAFSFDEWGKLGQPADHLPPLKSVSHSEDLARKSVPENEQLENLTIGTLDPNYGTFFTNKCIEDLGCFYNGPPFFDYNNRPISLHPADVVPTTFLLYTRSNHEEPSLLDLTKESVESNPHFDASLATKILIHGYEVVLHPGDVRFLMKHELLEEGPYNVIIVDWTESNQFFYPQAVANARVVGAQTAKLIQLLMEHKGIPAESVHIIGHSLGAQAAGWAGERVPGLGRITGLDPAGPDFHNAPPEVRLDPTDAEFVDVIHSNGGFSLLQGLGISEAIGHMDFYPNGGSFQPGCFYYQNLTDDFYRNMTDDYYRNMTDDYYSHLTDDYHRNMTDDYYRKISFLMTDVDPALENHYLPDGCDHSRANYLFLDSVNRCSYWAVECESFEVFERGLCKNNGTIGSFMGLKAQKIPELEGPATFYLYTDGETPFCNVQTPEHLH